MKSRIGKLSFFLKMCTAWFVLLGLLGQSLPGFAGAAGAEEARIGIQAEPGFGASNVKLRKWTPVKFTLHNPGADVSGDLAVQIVNPGEGKDNTFVSHVELPKGSTKTVTLLLPGSEYAKGNNSVAFYRDSIQKGKAVSLEGTAYLETFSIPADTVQVGVLARDADTMNFLAVLSQSGNKVNVLHLKEADIPASALGLDGIDVLVLNDFASDTLSAEQIQAIKTWVQRGGRLILAGGAGYPKTAAPFADAAPVAYQGTASVQELPQLAKLAEKELALPQPFTLSKAQLVQGAETIAAEGDVPVYASKALGSGKIVYAAYDLSLNPLASWNGNPGLWRLLLKEPFDEMNKYRTNQNRYGPDPYWDLNRALEYFPALKPPKLTALTWTLLLYAVVVGPLLYWLLRRVDRREWAWVAIPALAIVTSIGIFQFGAANRGSMLAQALNIVELDGNGSGIKASNVSVFLPKGGSLDMQFPGGAQVAPIMQDNFNSSQQITGRSELTIRQDNDAARVRIQDIPYSSVSKMKVYDEAPLAAGKFEYSFTDLSAGSAKGKITNHSKKDLTDVVLLMNQSVVKIGELKAGATASFDTAGGTGISFGPDVANVIFTSPAAGGADTGFRQRSLLNGYLHNRQNVSGGFEPMIAGWVTEQQPIALGGGKSLPSEQLSLIVQHIKMSFVTPEGQIVIPGTALVPDIIDNNMQTGLFNFQSGPYIQLGTGDFTLDYKLPQIERASYTLMSMQLEPNSGATLELWNAASQKWETLDAQKSLNWDAEKLAPYILEGKSIRMKVASTQNHTTFRIPSISLEGKVKP